MSDILKSFFSFNEEQVSGLESDLIRLTIELGQYHVAYMTSSLDNQVVRKFEVLRSETKIDVAEIQQFIDHLGSLSEEFASVHLVLNNGLSTLMPASHFREEDAERILNILFTDATPRKVYSHKIPDWELVALSAIPFSMLDRLQNRFQFNTVTPITAGYLSSTDFDGLDGSSQIVKLFFYPGSFTVLIIRGKTLQLIQEHDYHTVHDVTFALLQACSQSEIETETALLKISGAISEDASLFKELMKLFRQISLESPSLSVGSDDAQTPPHIFTPYIHSLTCV